MQRLMLAHLVRNRINVHVKAHWGAFLIIMGINVVVGRVEELEQGIDNVGRVVLKSDA